ncbi:hypothetical protein PSEUBRA_001305 [Kalmanozyma brasiliensis GHG001]|uniref:Zn(2)-C6 fungal-type domain-containing protein n=1 Tax=Kalmanozyma brasiliensis (strain GHG001) TaxID=1365824 RepID=V5GSS4_KALBG|nr:uncharacterized protein PSEUBRA_001305 [Kalmanozyma brasiliensis GHG001]EST08977.1 hypothetical protein PSEUBRA_001305 [Kalmanozyma brasiliensis GHG001]
MNTPPKFSHSRQGSVEHNLPTSTAAHLQHPALSGHNGSGSHTPGAHSPLTHYGHALASLAYPSSSYSPYRTGHTPIPSWGSSNPAALHTSSATPSAKRSQSRDAEEDEEDDDEDDEDNSDDSDDDDEDEDDDDDAEDSDTGDTSKAKQAGNKRKRDISPKSAKAKKATGAKDKAGGDKTGNGADGKSGAGGKKQKPTRGARACTNCRRLKMRCVGAEKGPPCNRCRNGNHECIFEESNRGKKGGKNQKAEAMQQSLRKMEQTLATVLRSIRDPGLAAQHGGMVTRSPSPSFPREPERPLPKETQRSDPRLTHSNSFSGTDYGPRSPWTRVADPYSSHGTHAGASPARISNDGASPVNTINPNAMAQRSAPSTDGSTHSPAHNHGNQGTRFLEPLPHHHRQQTRPGASGSEAPRHKSSRGSPRLHSLPDNTLNPLGLLAEASLHNTHRARKLARSAGSSSGRDKDSQRSGSTGGQSPDKTVKSEGGEDATPAGEGGAADGSSRQIPLGVASQNYFRPGPMTILPLRRIIIEREMPPELLTLGIVTSEEVLDLFSIFFRRCTQHVCLLDAEWHTPTFICSRSPFLFTCVCTVAAKFYERRPDLHAKCLALTRKVAFDVVNRGFKSIEIVQGFLLMALYAQPAERFEEDKTWMYSGIALRMATDLNLHRKSVATFNHSPHPDDPAVLDREREILNRERTWYVCFAMDRGLSIQMGKPYTIREDWIIRNCRNWGSRFSRPWDMSVSAVVDLYRISSRQLDFLYSSTSSVSGLNTEIDYSLVLPVFNEQLQEWREEWKWRGLFSMPDEGEEYVEKKKRKMAIAAEKAAAKEKSKGKGASASSKASAEPGAKEGAATNGAAAAKDVKYEYDDDDEDAENLDLNTRIMIHTYSSIPIRYSFAVLVLNSFGLQQAVDHPIGASLDRAQYFAKCLEAAKTIVVQCTGPSRRNMRYAPDVHILTLAYACVFLLKLIRPAFAGYVDEDSILALVQDAVDMLGEAAVNETHTPYLYASFLKALLQARRDHTTASKSATGSRVVSRAVTPEAMDTDEATAGLEGNASHSRTNTEGGLAGGNGMVDGIANSLDPSSADFAAGANGTDGVNWPSQMFAASSGMDEFWGSLLPPGFTQTSMHDLFGASTTDAVHTGIHAEAEVTEPAQHATKFGMGGGGAFDFGGGAIGNGNGGVPLNSAAASAALANSMSMTPLASGHISGANTPHGFGSRSRRTSASHFMGGLSGVNFDFSS